MTTDTEPQAALLASTVDIVAAYVSSNSVPPAELPNLIRSVHQSLAALGAAPAAEPVAETLRPAVPVRRSVTDEYIVSLEDGRRMKSMKRHLAGLGMTPADYRAKWGLPADYPMVAPAYARQRSALARTIGLGRKPAEEPPQPVPAPVAEPAPVKAKRGRKAA